MKTNRSWIYPIAIIGLLANFTFGCEKDVDFEGGKGTQDDPYLIASPKQLDGMRHNLNRHFKQIADIDLSGYSSGEGWRPIGDEKNPFTGTFDGNSHNISNLTIDRPNMHYVGLFGMTEKSTIKNTGLVMIEITGELCLGGLVGHNGGDIINCYATGDVSGYGDAFGGLVGWNGGNITNSYATAVISGYAAGVGGLVGENTGNITFCFATGDIPDGSYTGGLVGENRGKIANSYATGNVTGGHFVGGLVGSNHEGGDIINSYAKGHVIGSRNVGGFVGWSSGSIRNCYATGNVAGSEYTGGLVGRYNGGNIEYSYYDKETTGQEDTGKGIPRTTVEMMQQSTFETWDFTNIWRINEGNSYPYLRWQE